MAVMGLQWHLPLQIRAGSMPGCMEVVVRNKMADRTGPSPSARGRSSDRGAVDASTDVDTGDMPSDADSHESDVRLPPGRHDADSPDLSCGTGRPAAVLDLAYLRSGHDRP